ncbi:MAG: hypothetical protein LLG44_05725 [Chloroflexi bacterium]|nr:hypothetical protein [Chloroflexota bacterium]
MHRTLSRIALIAVLATCLASALTLTAAADGPNLLQNPSFERPYVSMAIKENCRIAAPWVPYYYEGSPAETSQGYRLAPEYKAAFYWEAPGNRVRSGELAQQFFHSYGNFEGGIFQQVNGVTPGQLLRFETWALVWSCDKESKGNCSGNTSGDPSPMHLRIGIDPQGGVDAKSADIVWSDEMKAYDAWRLMQVEAVAQNSSVTVFVYSYPDYRSQDNNVYLDDASLVAATSRILPVASATPTAAIAVAGTAAPEMPAAAGSWPQTGVLLGSRGGAYAHFPVSFESAAPVTLVMQATPYDTLIANGVGFNVYGPGGLAGTAAPSGTSNTRKVTFAPQAGAEYLVQVYNYIEGLPVYYTLQR